VTIDNRSVRWILREDDGTSSSQVDRSTLRLDDQLAGHAGFGVTGDATVEGVRAGRGRREERQGRRAGWDRNMDIERVDVEGVYLGVAVLGRRATVSPTLARSSAWLNVFRPDTSAGGCASASALTPAVAPDGGMAATRIAPSANVAVPIRKLVSQRGVRPSAT
jgi:hypothetical protein